MSGLVIYQLGADSGIEVAVATDDPESQQEDGAGIQRVARGDRLEIQAKERFEQALDHIKPIARAVMERVRGIGESLSEVEVAFGVKLHTKWGVIITGGIDADLKITLKWNRKDDLPSPPP
jgi:hypothetical protein